MICSLIWLICSGILPKGSSYFSSTTTGSHDSSHSTELSTLFLHSLKFASHNPKRFFYKNWNSFFFLIVLIKLVETKLKTPISNERKLHGIVFFLLDQWTHYIFSIIHRIYCQNATFLNEFLNKLLSLILVYRIRTGSSL